jgi:hypothetical protein
VVRDSHRHVHVIVNDFFSPCTVGDRRCMALVPVGLARCGCARGLAETGKSGSQDVYMTFGTVGDEGVK